MKLQQLKKGSFIITIPKELVLAKGWKKGTQLFFSLDKADLKITKLK